jgi:hypothetical protein
MIPSRTSVQKRVVSCTSHSGVARVTFDDAIANVPTLIAATTNAGYPSSLVN